MSSRVKVGEVLLNCNDSNRYIVIEKIGTGQYGDIYKVRDRTQPWGGRFMAKKTFKGLFGGGERVISQSLPELKILVTLQHENVIKLIDFVQENTESEDNVPLYSIIMDFCEHDIEGILRSQVKLAIPVKKNLVMQMTKGLQYLHDLGIMHRDLKPQNILLSNSGVLKITDFGMAKINDGSSHTTKVGTLNYLAPEIILGDERYDQKIDMWALGCVIAQLWQCQPIFKGKTEPEILSAIARLCGPISRETWPSVEGLPFYGQYAGTVTAVEPRQILAYFSVLIDSLDAVHLIDQLLKVNPQERLDTKDVLGHPFLNSPPMASLDEISILLSHLPHNMLYLATYKRQCQLAKK